MLKWWFDSRKREQEMVVAVNAVRAKQAACKHEGRFWTFGIGRAMCRDCGAEVGLDEACSVYFRKMDAILDWYKQAQHDAQEPKC